MNTLRKVTESMRKTLAPLLSVLLASSPSWAEDTPNLTQGGNPPLVSSQSSVVLEGLPISSVEVTGVTVFPKEQVDRLIRLGAGQLYQRAVLEEDIAKIQDLYDQGDWVLESVDFTLDPTNGKLSVYVVETVVESIIVVGNVKTSTEGVVLPNLRSRTGSVLNRRRFGKDLERLRNIGYFRAVEAEVRRGLVKGKVTLIFDVEEAKTGLETIGAGYSGGGSTGVGHYRSESYQSVPETGYCEVLKRSLSTFSIDVDTASYSNARRFLTQGELPVTDAVRVEEFINYFTYDYPQPQGKEPFSVTTELTECPWNPANQLLRVGLQGRRTEAERTPPRNLVFLIDVSGSMEEPDKLPLVKRSLQLLLSTLNKQDHVAIVVYAGREELVLPATSCDQKSVILEKIATLREGSATNGSAGIQLAYQTARENFRKGAINRVILCTDGDFNMGLTGDALDRLIEQERNHGIFLTVLGFGTGNLKDDTMESLADKGNGNYAYIDSLLEARKVLVRESGSTLETIAKDVKLQIEFNPKRVHQYRLVGYENRRLEDKDFENDKKDAGDLGAGHSVTALYELVLDGPEQKSSLRYQKQSPTEMADSGELAMVKLRYKETNADISQLLELPIGPMAVGFSHASEDTRFAASVAAFGMLLRESEYRGQADFSKIESWARESIGRDPNGERHEFLRLVELASALSATAELATDPR